MNSWLRNSWILIMDCNVVSLRIMKSSEQIDREPELDEVTLDNANDLTQLRLTIDNNKTPEELKKESEKFASREGYKAFIVRKGESPMGYVQVKLEEELPPEAGAIEGLENMAHLARIGVVEECRGQGIGPKLLAIAEKWAHDEGKAGMWLGYLVSNEAAARLYEGAGYEDVAEFTDPLKGKLRRITVKRF